MIPDDVVEQVRTQADIVAIVGEVVKLKRVGTSFRGPCPFHQGKNPNFAVTPGGGYVCFVCGEKGDVFTFVQKRLGLDFVDAVKYVGAKSGVDVKEVARDAAQAVDPRQRFWEINAAAAEFFRASLWDDAGGSAAREYLESRALTREEADRFGIGFAPRDPAALRTHLEALGYGEEVLVQSGLLVVKDTGEVRTRFRNRVMFPIYDIQGRVIGFGGRVIGQGEPKYLNSAESPTFQKGSTLYGLNWARHAIRRDGRVLLVEGYFDCVRLLAAGIESAVAPMGTALTDAQAALIAKYTSTAFLLYDSDQAGLKATFRNGDVLLKHGVKVLVATLPDGEDPDTFVRTQGPRQLEAQLGSAIDVFERKLQILQRGGWLSDLRRKRAALDRLLPTIRAAADPLTFGLYLRRASEAAGIDEAALRDELRGRERFEAPQRDGRPAQQPQRISHAKAKEAYRAEEWVVRVLLANPVLAEWAGERIDPVDFRDARYAAIYRGLLAAEQSEGKGLAIEDLPEHAIRAYEELVGDKPLPDPQRTLDGVLRTISERQMNQELDDLAFELRRAGDLEKNEILSKIAGLSARLRSIGGRRWKSVRPIAVTSEDEE